MNDANTLNARLDTLAQRIEEARRGLELEEKLHAHDRLTSGELAARYNFLKAQLAEDIADIEAHDHRVSELERAVLGWIEAIDFDA